MASSILQSNGSEEWAPPFRCNGFRASNTSDAPLWLRSYQRPDNTGRSSAVGDGHGNVVAVDPVVDSAKKIHAVDQPLSWFGQKNRPRGLVLGGPSSSQSIRAKRVHD